MDEMTAFDQQIAREVVREAGPSEPVDGAAIFSAITATQSPKWRLQSMFSATKFVVAGALVALFGGVLLAGVLTQPSEEPVPPAGASASVSPSVDASAEATDGPQDLIVAPDGSGDFDTIGSAVEAATDGDTVLVRPSTYEEGVLVEKDIAIRGDGDRDEIIVTGDADSLSCAYQAPVSCAFWLKETDATLANLTLRGARNPDGSTFPFPLLVDDGAPTIEGVVVEGDMAVSWGSTATVRDSIVLGSMQANDGGRPLVEDSVIRAVSSDNGAAPVVRGNTVGGLMIFAGGSGVFEDNEVTRSDDGLGGSPSGVGIRVSDPGRGLVVRENRVRGYDVGIDLQDRRYVVTLTGNVIEGNRVGLRVDAIGNLAISENMFCDNVLHVRASSGRAPAGVTESCGDAAMVRTTPDLLPGVDLVTEEVEPGVYRVLSDGIRELTGVSPECRIWIADGLAVAPDRAVWLHTDQVGRDPSVSELIRLGDPDAYPLPSQEWWGLNVGPDGALWAVDGSGMLPIQLRLGSEGWSKVAETGGVATAADGTIDVVPSVVLERLRADLADVKLKPEAEGYFVVAPDGDVWAALTLDDPHNWLILVRFDGESWSFVDPLGVGAYAMVLPHVGADGTVWVNLETEYADVDFDPGHRYLARYADDEGWTVFPTEDGFRLVSGGDNVGLLRVDQSGAAWMQSIEGPVGVRAFDGQTWRRYLEAHSVCDMEVAPDGRVWILSDDLYVIDPATAAAAE